MAKQTKVATKVAKTKISYAKEYTWVPGSRFRDLDPRVVGIEIDRLLEKHKQKLSADTLVEEAAAPGSPLREVFHFGEDEAMAAEHRLELARKLLRSVRVTIITPQRKEVTVRLTVATERDKKPNEKSYSTTEYALSDPELRAEVLGQALRELSAFKRRYCELSELAIVFSAIDSIAKRA